MIIKKITIGVLTLIFLSGCAQNAALIGPAYTLATTGNTYHAGFTYGGNKFIKKATGKSTTENLKEVLTIKKQDSDFQKLVKNNISKTRKKLNLSNQ